MELYLDSANLKEIGTAFRLGFLYGLTTTPTFMHRDGITDVDATIVELSRIVPVLQVEALGESAEEVVAEAERLLALGLDRKKTVFKIPISLEGARACRMLTDKGCQVNLHLIYTVQQAYIAFSAGATYVCPLVGRLQDQGHDALAVVEQCVDAVERYGYASKVMFSSVRNPEHVRNAINIGAHACTIPWKVLQQLASNHFTDIGTAEFFEHTRQMTLTAGQAMRPYPATVNEDKTVLDALVDMTMSKLGAVTVVNASGGITGIFTDGDLRRKIQSEGEAVLQRRLKDLGLNIPTTIESDEKLIESSRLFREKKIDTIVVVQDGKPVGMLDIHDLLQPRKG